jgi:glycosyltransferase involved in cell wall biosynthesis
VALVEESSAASPSPAAASPLLSVVVLTWNEERNIRACLASLSRQRRKDFEVIVIDAASHDATADIVRDIARDFPVPLRLEVAPTRITVGLARNRGVELAQADIIAFLSADTEADPYWTQEALRAIDTCDVLYGRQIHAPTTKSVAASVRGLHYHFPETTTDQPARYASNVNAVIRRRVLEAFPFGSSKGESALDDILLTHRSQKAGHRIDYNPAMVVRHRDVESAKAEFSKNLREGRGWGELAPELGLNNAILAWGGILLGAITLLVIAPSWLTLALLAVVLYAPALRRVWRRRASMRASQLLLGALISPAFDLTFLLAYVRGLFTRKGAGPPPRQGRETHV